MSRRELTWAYVSLGAAWCYVAASSFVAAQNPGNLTQSLTTLQQVLLELAVFGPLLGIWLIALHGAVALKRYARLTEGSPEAHGLTLIATGLFWLVGYLILLSILGAVVQNFAHHRSIALVVSFKNHLLVMVGLVGSSLLYYGSHLLKRAAPFRVWNRSAVWLLVLFCLGAAAFTWLFTWSDANADRNGIPLYALSKPILIFSFILPYTLAWFLGLLAGLNITQYANAVKGTIYRAALRQLVWGLVALTALSMMLQVLGLASIIVSGLNLALTLLLVYLLLFLYAGAFWLVRAGAKQLARLEAAS